jgi:hypothetical protein
MVQSQLIQRQLLICRWVWWLWMEGIGFLSAKQRSSWSDQEGTTKVFKHSAVLTAPLGLTILSALLVQAPNMKITPLAITQSERRSCES